MSGVDSVRVVVEVAAVRDVTPDPVFGWLTEVSWCAIVSDPADVDGPPLAVVWSDVGPDQAAAAALARVTFTGELGGAEGRGAGA